VAVVNLKKFLSLLNRRSAKEFEFKCSCCGDIHQGIPSYVSQYPPLYHTIPEEERETRVNIRSDDCVIDEEWFFVRGCIEIRVRGYSDPFVWGVWVSLSQDNYQKWLEHFDQKERSHVAPFFAWLTPNLGPYPITDESLKTMVHLRDNGIRPFIEIQKTSHPLSIEYHKGISPDRLIEIYEMMEHPKDN